MSPQKEASHSANPLTTTGHGVPGKCGSKDRLSEWMREFKHVDTEAKFVKIVEKFHKKFTNLKDQHRLVNTALCQCCFEDTIHSKDCRLQPREYQAVLKTGRNPQRVSPNAEFHAVRGDVRSKLMEEESAAQQDIVVDSGTSQHIFCDKNLFISYSTSVNTTVTMPEGSRTPAAGIGTASVRVQDSKGVSQTMTLGNVL